MIRTYIYHKLAELFIDRVMSGVVDGFTLDGDILYGCDICSDHIGCVFMLMNPPHCDNDGWINTKVNEMGYLRGVVVPSRNGFAINGFVGHTLYRYDIVPDSRLVFVRRIMR